MFTLFGLIGFFLNGRTCIVDYSFEIKKTIINIVVTAMVNGLPTNEEIDERLKFVQEQAKPPVKNVLESILIDRMENWR